MHIYNLCDTTYKLKARDHNNKNPKYNMKENSLLQQMRY